MLREHDRLCKTSNKTCPRCKATGNFVGHGSYMRWFDDGSGPQRVRVYRVKCCSCKATHALLWFGMAPYKLRAEAIYLQTFRAWATGQSIRSLIMSTHMSPTSLRRMLLQVRLRLSDMLAKPSDRASLATAIATTKDSDLSLQHLSMYGRFIAEGATLRNIAQPCLLQIRYST